MIVLGTQVLPSETVVAICLVEFAGHVVTRLCRDRVSRIRGTGRPWPFLASSSESIITPANRKMHF